MASRDGMPVDEAMKMTMAHAQIASVIALLKDIKCDSKPFDGGPR